MNWYMSRSMKSTRFSIFLQMNFKWGPNHLVKQFMRAYIKRISCISLQKPLWHLIHTFTCSLERNILKFIWNFASDWETAGYLVWLEFTLIFFIQICTTFECLWGNWELKVENLYLWLESQPLFHTRGKIQSLSHWHKRYHRSWLPHFLETFH